MLIVNNQLSNSYRFGPLDKLLFLLSLSIPKTQQQQPPSLIHLYLSQSAQVVGEGPLARLYTICGIL